MSEMTFEKLTRADVDSAALPAVYESAQRAMAECYRIDECMTWANKAAALASYARQIDDETLLDLAKRIKARAIRHAGLLLKEVEPQPGARTDQPYTGTGTRLLEEVELSSGGRPAKTNTGTGTSFSEPYTGAGTRLTRNNVAQGAGLSKRQKDTALRVAAIPADEFEDMVESGKAPTITGLAEQGTRKRAPGPDGIAMEDHAVAVKLIELLNHVRREGSAIDISRAMHGIRPSEITVIQSAFNDAFRVLMDVQRALDAYESPTTPSQAIDCSVVAIDPSLAPGRYQL